MLLYCVRSETNISFSTTECILMLVNISRVLCDSTLTQQCLLCDSIELALGINKCNICRVTEMDLKASQLVW